MFTYDAFAFSQTTFVLFVILALGSAYELAVQPQLSAEAVRFPIGRSLVPLDQPVSDIGR